jgi:hypothetical protein
MNYNGIQKSEQSLINKTSTRVCVRVTSDRFFDCETMHGDITIIIVQCVTRLLKYYVGFASSFPKLYYNI